MISKLFVNTSLFSLEVSVLYRGLRIVNKDIRHVLHQLWIKQQLMIILTVVFPENKSFYTMIPTLNAKVMRPIDWNSRGRWRMLKHRPRPHSPLAGVAPACFVLDFVRQTGTRTDRTKIAQIVCYQLFKWIILFCICNIHMEATWEAKSSKVRKRHVSIC